MKALGSEGTPSLTPWKARNPTRTTSPSDRPAKESPSCGNSTGASTAASSPKMKPGKRSAVSWRSYGTAPPSPATPNCASARKVAAGRPRAQNGSMETPLTELALRRAEKIERLRGTMRRKRAAGEVTGRLPMGYVSVRGSGGSVAQEDPETMRLLAEAAELRSQGMSIRSIRKEMHWRGLKGRSGRPVSVSGLWSLLKQFDRP